jgi:hypothetical protein
MSWVAYVRNEEVVQIRLYLLHNMIHSICKNGTIPRALTFFCTPPCSRHIWHCLVVDRQGWEHGVAAACVMDFPCWRCRWCWGREGRVWLCFWWTNPHQLCLFEWRGWCCSLVEIRLTGEEISQLPLSGAPAHQIERTKVLIPKRQITDKIIDSRIFIFVMDDNWRCSWRIWKCSQKKKKPLTDFRAGK